MMKLKNVVKELIKSESKLALSIGGPPTLRQKSSIIVHIRFSLEKIVMESNNKLIP